MNLSSITTYLAAHPELVVFVLTAVFSWFTRDRTEAEYVAMNPRMAAFLKLVASLGIDTPKLVRQIQQLISGVPVPVPGFVMAAKVVDPTPKEDSVK